MSKNILVLTGGPRKGGNSDLMADAFIKGAGSAGHAVAKYETAFKEIGGCKACDRCYSTGEACVSGDDFNTPAPLLEQNDVLAISTPLYRFTFPAQLKAALDKMHAFTLAADRAASRDVSCLLVPRPRKKLISAASSKLTSPSRPI